MAQIPSNSPAVLDAIPDQPEPLKDPDKILRQAGEPLPYPRKGFYKPDRSALPELKPGEFLPDEFPAGTPWDEFTPDELSNPEIIRRRDVYKSLLSAQAAVLSEKDPRWGKATPSQRRYMVNVRRARWGLPPVTDDEAFARVGAGEEIAKQIEAPQEFVPIVGSGIEAAQLYSTIRAAHRIEKGQADLDDYETIAKYLEEQAYYGRGTTVGGAAVRIGAESTKFVEDLAVAGFGARAAVRAIEKGLTKVGAGRLLEKSAARLVKDAVKRKLVEKTLQKAVGESATRAALKKMGFIAGKAALKGIGYTPFMAQRVAVNTLQRRVPGFALTPEADKTLRYISTAPVREPWLKSLMLGAAQTSIATGTEFAGGAIEEGLKIGGRALGRFVKAVTSPEIGAAPEAIAALRARMVAALANKYGWGLDAAAVHLQNVGIDGLLGEIGEERLEEILDYAAGVTQNYDPPTPEEFVKELAGFAGLIGMGHVGAEAKMRTRKYKPADMLHMARYAVATDIDQARELAGKEPTRANVPWLARKEQRDQFMEVLREVVAQADREIENAKQDAEASQVDENVREHQGPPPGEEQVPAEEGGAGVREGGQQQEQAQPAETEVIDLSGTTNVAKGQRVTWENDQGDQFTGTVLTNPDASAHVMIHVDPPYDTEASVPSELLTVVTAEESVKEAAPAKETTPPVEEPAPDEAAAPADRSKPTPAEGAVQDRDYPNPTPIREKGPPNAREWVGRPTPLYDDNMHRHEAVLDVVPLESVVPSHVAVTSKSGEVQSVAKNPEYEKKSGYQARERSAIPAVAQVNDIATNPQLDVFTRSGSSPVDGPPVTEHDEATGKEYVVQGNGRVIGMSAWTPQQWEEYKKALKAEGVEIPEGVDRPVLIRRLTRGNAAHVAAFGQGGGGLQQTRLERAAALAAGLDLDTMPDITHVPTRMDEDSVEQFLADNPAFKKWLVGEHKTLAADKEALADRARAAFLAMLPKPIVDAARAMGEDFERALLVMAPFAAKIKSDIAAGKIRPQYDLYPVMNAAGYLFQSLAESGKSPAKFLDDLVKVSETATLPGMEGVDILSEEGAIPSVALAVGMNRASSLRSPEASMSEWMHDLYQRMRADSPEQAKLFAGAETEATDVSGAYLGAFVPVRTARAIRNRVEKHQARTSPAATMGFPGERAGPVPKGQKARKAAEQHGQYPPNVQQPPDLKPFSAARKQIGDTRRHVRKMTAEVIRAMRTGKDAGPAADVFKIVEDLTRWLGIGPVRADDKRRIRKSLGYYVPIVRRIRLKYGHDLQTFFHEIGHAIDEMLFKATGKKGRADTRFPKHWRKELVALGKALYGSTKPAAGYTREGFAEFLRLWVTDPASAADAAPTVFAEFGDLLQSVSPETYDILQNARVRFEAAKTLGERPLMTLIGYQRNKSWREVALRNVADRIIIDWFNYAKRAATVDKDLGRDPANPVTGLMPRAQHVRNFASGAFAHMIRFGTFDPADPANPATQRPDLALGEIWDGTIPSELMAEAIAALHAIDKRRQGFNVFDDVKNPVSTSDAALKAFVERVRKEYPGFDEKLAKHQEFNRWFIGTYLPYFGLIDKKAAETILKLNPYYMPLWSEPFAEPTERMAGGGAAGLRKGLKRFIKGRILGRYHPPLDSYLRSIQQLTMNAHLNQVKALFFNAISPLPGSGNWLSKVPRPMQHFKVPGDDLAKRVLREMGVRVTDEGIFIEDSQSELNALNEDDLYAVVNAVQAMSDSDFFSPSSKIDRKAMTYGFYRDGQPVFVQVHDKMLYELIDSLTSPAGVFHFSNTLAESMRRVATVPAQVLRAGATTYNPTWILSNFTRDSVTALMITEADLRRMPKRAAAYYRALRDAWTEGDIYKLFLHSGGYMSGIFDELKSMDDLRSYLKKQRQGVRLKRGNVRQQLVDVLTAQPIARINEVFELANRLVEFELVRDGKTDRASLIKAGYAASQVTLDFSGGGRLSKAINEYVPFFNAGMLSVAQASRIMKDNPARTLGRLFSVVVAPTVAELGLIAAVGDPDDYFRIPVEERDRYWHFPLFRADDGHTVYVRLRKPYIFGIVGSAIERTVAKNAGIDPATGQGGGDPQAFRKFSTMVLDDLRPSFSPMGIQPILEVLAGTRGWSYYWKRPIVAAADEGLPVELQGRLHSSRTARWLTSLFKEYLGVEIAPAKIDHLIRGLTGGAGRDATRFIFDPLLGIGKSKAEAPGPPPEALPIVRAIIFKPSWRNAESINQFFDSWEHARSVYRGARALSGPEANDYRRRNKDVLRVYPVLKRAHRLMGKQFKAARAILLDPHVPDAQKRRAADEFYKSAAEIAERAMRFMRNIRETSPN